MNIKNKNLPTLPQIAEKAQQLVEKATELSRKRQEKPTSYYSRFLSRAVLLEESGPPAAVVSTIMVVSLFVFGCVIWSGVTTLQETSMASGQIVPASSVQPVQHLEGGIVARVLVEDGQQVKKGQTLLRLASSATYSELERVRARKAALGMQVVRLKAFSLQAKPDFSPFIKDFPGLVRDQQDILEQQNKSLKAQENVIFAKVSAQENQHSVLEKQEQTQKNAMDIIGEELKIREGLTKKGLGSKIRLLEVQRQFNNAEGELQATQIRKTGLLASIREAEGHLVELRTRLNNDALNQVGAMTEDLTQVMAELKRLNDKAQRLDVVAPTDGTVKGLKYRSVGSIIPPGDVVAEIVPYSDFLVAEVKISPRDIGHVKVGKEVLVKIDTYNFARFGGISGILNHVSASSFMNERGETYFKGVVKLPRNYIGSNPDSNRITPGMTVVADIKTGEKTVLQYLVKPINNALNTSFRER